MGKTESVNFIESIVNKELEDGLWAENEICTRFPPEPNGYLHIGHAKSLCINFGIKKKYNGKCNLRYDDTNPTKEDIEYVESIKEDIKWLGFHWDKELYASDYFEQMYQYALQLIRDGKAYVCDMSAEEIKNSRGTLTEAGKESPYRLRDVEENIRLFKDMREGVYKDGEKVLRAKIDMTSPNINMRDPVIYRILRAKHHRTGNDWLIYPMYDYAHPISDAIENITHSICTLEFEDHRPLYDWVKINCGFKRPPRQIEFARLNLTRTIMSKRYLKSLVDKKVVSGWNDPRMPTLAGMRNRGYPPEAIKDFCEKIGVSKANSEVSVNLLEYCVREYLNDNAYRVMVVENPVKLIIDNLDDNYSEMLNLEYLQDKDVSREVPFSRELYIEKSDFAENPPPKYHRLYPGGMVRLKGAYILKYVSHKNDQNGEVQEIHCEYIENSKSGGINAGIKVKGVIHWVDAKTCINVTLNKYDYLLNDSNTGEDFSLRMNNNSLIIIRNAKGERELINSLPFERYQFVRQAYYMTSPNYNKNNLSFNLIVSLKDSFKG